MQEDFIINGKVVADFSSITQGLRNVERSAVVNVKADGAQALGRLTSKVSEFDKSMDAANARVLAFGASAAVISGISIALKAMVSNAISVEAKLADINSILRLSSGSLGQFSSDLFEVAKDTGQSFDTVTESAKEFSRQGLDVEQTLQRTKDAMILVRLSGLSAADATNTLTASINAFEKAGLTSTQIVNKMATVDANFAVSTKDLAEALSRAGNSVQDAGNSFEEFIALVTAAQERTARGGAVIGNALKSIFNREGRSKTMDELEGLGIAVRDVSGSTLPAITVLTNLATTYDTLSDASKNNVAQLVGGVYQMNILKALLSDLAKSNSTYSKARDIATASDEAAMRRNEELNMTMVATVKAAQANFTKLTASAGKITFEPVIRNVLGLFNAIGKAGAGDGSGEDIGSKIGNGLLTGLGNVLKGPGLVALLGIGMKLTASFAQFSTAAMAGLLGINAESRKMIATQEGVAALLRSNPTLMDAMLAPMTTRAQKEEQFLAALGRETVATEALLKIRRDLAAVAIGAGMSQSPVKSGWQGTMNTGSKTKTSKASGHIPIEQVGGAAVAHEVSEAKKAGYSIDPSDVRAMRAKINGQLSTVVYNKREKVIDNFMGTGEPAIIPPNKSLGQMMNSATGRFPLHAPGGFVPNAANKKAMSRAGSFFEEIGLPKSTVDNFKFRRSRDKSDIGEYRSDGSMNVFFDNILKKVKEGWGKGRYRAGYANEQAAIDSVMGNVILHEGFHGAFAQNPDAARAYFSKKGITLPANAKKFLEKHYGRAGAKGYAGREEEEMMAIHLPQQWGYASAAKGRLTLPYGSAEYSIKGTQAKINHVLSPEEGKGNLGKIYDALFATFRNKGVKKISGDLAANLRAVPRSGSSADKLTAMFPQISRARRAVMSEIVIGGQTFRIKGKNYEEDLGMQAYDILKAVNMPGGLEGVKMHSYLAAGQIPMASRGIPSPRPPMGADGQPSWVSEALKKKPKTLKEKIAYKAAQAANWALTKGPAWGEMGMKLGDALGFMAGGNMPIIHAAEGPPKRHSYKDSKGKFAKAPIQLPVTTPAMPAAPLQQTIGEQIQQRALINEQRIANAKAQFEMAARERQQAAARDAQLRAASLPKPPASFRPPVTTPAIPAAPVMLPKPPLPKPPASFRPDIRMTRSGMFMNAVLQAQLAGTAQYVNNPANPPVKVSGKLMPRPGFMTGSGISTNMAAQAQLAGTAQYVNNPANPPVKVSGKLMPRPGFMTGSGISTNMAAQAQLAGTAQYVNNPANPPVKVSGKLMPRPGFMTGGPPKGPPNDPPKGPPKGPIVVVTAAERAAILAAHEKQVAANKAKAIAAKAAAAASAEAAKAAQDIASDKVKEAKAAKKAKIDARNAKASSIGMMAAFAIPMAGGMASSFVNQESAAGQIKAQGINQIATGLGTGMMMGSMFGPYGVAAGAVIGGGIGTYQAVTASKRGETATMANDRLLKAKEGRMAELRGMGQSTDIMGQIEAATQSGDAQSVSRLYGSLQNSMATIKDPNVRAQVLATTDEKGRAEMLAKAAKKEQETEARDNAEVGIKAFRDKYGKKVSDYDRDSLEGKASLKGIAQNIVASGRSAKDFDREISSQFGEGAKTEELKAALSELVTSLEASKARTDALAQTQQKLAEQTINFNKVIGQMNSAASMKRSFASEESSNKYNLQKVESSRATQLYAPFMSESAKAEIQYNTESADIKQETNTKYGAISENTRATLSGVFANSKTQAGKELGVKVSTASNEELMSLTKDAMGIAGGKEGKQEDRDALLKIHEQLKLIGITEKGQLDIAKRNFDYNRAEIQQKIQAQSIGEYNTAAFGRAMGALVAKQKDDEKNRPVTVRRQDGSDSTSSPTFENRQEAMRKGAVALASYDLKQKKAGENKDIAFNEMNKQRAATGIFSKPAYEGQRRDAEATAARVAFAETQKRKSAALGGITDVMIGTDNKSGALGSSAVGLFTAEQNEAIRAGAINPTGRARSGQLNIDESIKTISGAYKMLSVNKGRPGYDGPERQEQLESLYEMLKMFAAAKDTMGDEVQGAINAGAAAFPRTGTTTSPGASTPAAMKSASLEAVALTNREGFAGMIAASSEIVEAIMATSRAQAELQNVAFTQGDQIEAGKKYAIAAAANEAARGNVTMAEDEEAKALQLVGKAREKKNQPEIAKAEEIYNAAVAKRLLAEEKLKETEKPMNEAFRNKSIADGAATRAKETYDTASKTSRDMAQNKDEKAANASLAKLQAMTSIDPYKNKTTPESAIKEFEERTKQTRKYAQDALLSGGEIDQSEQTKIDEMTAANRKIAESIEKLIKAKGFLAEVDQKTSKVDMAGNFTIKIGDSVIVAKSKDEIGEAVKTWVDARIKEMLDAEKGRTPAVPINTVNP